MFFLLVECVTGISKMLYTCLSPLFLSNSYNFPQRRTIVLMRKWFLRITFYECFSISSLQHFLGRVLVLHALIIRLTLHLLFFEDKRTEIIMSYLSTDNSKFQAGNLTFLSECRIENVRKNSSTKSKVCQMKISIKSCFDLTRRQVARQKSYEL